MRKIIVLSMISLDGVIQSPGSPEEDPANGFKLGGWVAPYSDEVYGKVVLEEMKPADYLLGRKTYEIWADYWPKHSERWPAINAGTKYVFSTTMDNTNPKVIGWKNSVVLNKLTAIKKLKNSDGPDIQVWGSSELVHLLLEHGLVDELRLKIHPLILGKGKRIWGDNMLPAAFKLTESLVTTTGVLIARYERAGAVKTGTIGARKLRKE